MVFVTSISLYGDRTHSCCCWATLDPQHANRISHGKCCCCGREFSNAAAHSNRAHMQTTTRFSRHARIPGDCPVCLYPLQGRNITQRPCQHMLCTPCYHDGVQLGSKDSSFNPDACEQCRDTPCTMTRHGSTLTSGALRLFQVHQATRGGDVAEGRVSRAPPSRPVPWA